MGKYLRKCNNMNELIYKLLPVNIDADKVENIDFPELKDRVIQKFGDVVEFSLADIESADAEMIKRKKELQAKHDYEKVVMENIEHHHPFVKDMSEQDLLTVWMYKQSKGHVELCKENIAKLDAQLEADKKEIDEIIKQIPELGLKKSADVVNDEIILTDESK